MWVLPKNYLIYVYDKNIVIKSKTTNDLNEKMS